METSDTLEFLAEMLIRDEYLEDIEHITKEEAERVLELIDERTGKSHLLIINVNNERDGIYYDAVLSDGDKSAVIIEEWNNY